MFRSYTYKVSSNGVVDTTTKHKFRESRKAYHERPGVCIIDRDVPHLFSKSTSILEQVHKNHMRAIFVKRTIPVENIVCDLEYLAGKSDSQSMIDVEYSGCYFSDFSVPTSRTVAGFAAMKCELLLRSFYGRRVYKNSINSVSGLITDNMLSCGTRVPQILDYVNVVNYGISIIALICQAVFVEEDVSDECFVPRSKKCRMSEKLSFRESESIFNEHCRDLLFEKRLHQ